MIRDLRFLSTATTQAKNRWIDSVQFFRHDKLTSIGSDGKPEYNQGWYILGDGGHDTDMASFGHAVPADAREEFMAFRMGDRYFTFFQ